MKMDDLIQEYLDTQNDSTDIAGLLHLRERIAGELYFVATKVGEARKKFMGRKAIYEGTKMQIRMTHLDKGVGYAETVSRANTRVEYERQNEADGDFHLAKYQYDSAKEVLSALNQKISWLKEEAKYERVTG